MVKFCFSIIILIAFMACGEPKNRPSTLSELEKIAADTANFTSLQWKDSIINFGTIKQNQQIEITFYCTNTGTKPLYIIKVQPGCGCTTGDYTKEPIKPGEQGWVKAIFNSTNQLPEVHKSILVYCNTKPNTEHKLLFEGSITN